MNPNMDPQQCRRRSLKHRVNKIMRLSNFLSVSLFSFVLVVFFGIAIYLVGVSYSNYTSSQMAYGIGKVMSSTPEFLDDFLQQLNPQDGSFNKFDSSALMMENTLAPQQLHDLFNKAMNVANINAIEFRVWDKADNVFFNTIRPEEQKLFDSLWFTDIFTTEVVKEIRDVSGNILGKVGVQLNPFIYLFLIALIIGLGIFLLIINLIVTNILTLILSNIITKPLSRLKDELDNVASSNIECAISHEIKVKKPVIEVQYLLDATNNIMSKMNEYVATLNFQKDELESQATELESQTEELEAQTEELEAQKDELEAQNATLEERSSSLKFINSAYINRTLKLQNLLNNVGQGFLTISKDQTINPEYSFECEKMILSEHVKKISGMKITDTLFANSNQEEFLHDLIAKIFESDASQKELFLSLMPEELCLNERVLNIQYKLVSDEQQEEVLLIILTDITHTRNLEKQMDEERNNLNMIVKVLLNRGEFIDLVMDYKE
ncbi:MAG: hypothetical protein H7X94_10265, partial [Vallitaleaceae bacterium]|nr:hypothetical protein [Vallitaleaceae bacterium]